MVLGMVFEETRFFQNLPISKSCLSVCLSVCLFSPLSYILNFFSARRLQDEGGITEKHPMYPKNTVKYIKPYRKFFRAGVS